MAKRRSDEARVLDYFTSAPTEKAELMLGLVRDVVKRRTAPAKVVRSVAKPRMTRAKKLAAVRAGMAADANAEVLAQ
jgi:hypothetical protein